MRFIRPSVSDNSTMCLFPVRYTSAQVPIIYRKINSCYGTVTTKNTSKQCACMIKIYVHRINWTKKISMWDFFLRTNWATDFFIMYRGADKSLARPGRKQARKNVRYERDFNNFETRAVIKFLFPARQGAEGNSRHSDRNIILFPSWSG